MTVNSYIIVSLLTCTLLAAACGNSDNKNLDTTEKDKIDTTQIHPENQPESPTGTTRGLNSDNPDILSHIDKYLISTPNFTPPASKDGGITNATVTVENKLPEATFQKAFVEVSILLSDGKEYRTDYFTVINIGPGESKVISIPNAARGDRINSHIVKLKSAELTNGEMVLVGSRYVPR
jgi:hypothetical protein